MAVAEETGRADQPAGHYNRTVQPGDQPGLVGKILFVLAVILGFVYLL